MFKYIANINYNRVDKPFTALKEVIIFIKKMVFKYELNKLTIEKRNEILEVD